jgi:hypothetical protein
MTDTPYRVRRARTWQTVIKPDQAFKVRSLTLAVQRNCPI